MRAFVVRQFKKQDVLWASEIQGIRDFGSETAVQQVQTEVARKLGRLRNDAEASLPNSMTHPWRHRRPHAEA